ncbi:Ig-like domain-containing protein [Mycolicibacterium vanbaalenii]|uniref:Ig-like domain-containing protein n=1 Tax=Mycolicibacterium vanbaalenii TaxID=110539 RepID=UPI001F3F479E|nr:Ig-like domain-containing protein [Mycolicibacterium vanbaalenii]
MGKTAQRGRRAEGFAVRRWLQVGVASAGMGAALWGLSVVGPQVGLAGAESTESASSSESSSDAGVSSGTEKRSAAGGDGSASGGTAARDADSEDTGAAEGAAAEEGAAEDAAAEDAAADDAAADDAAREAVTDDADADPDEIESATRADESADDAGDPEVDRKDAVSDSTRPLQTVQSTELTGSTASMTTTAAEPVPAPPWLAPRRTWDETVAKIMSDWTARNQAWIDSLDVDDDRKAELEASFLALRRAFFNQAPTVAPIQISGRLTGPITGTVGAVDAEGDEIRYRLTRAPRTGSLVLNQDGTYTYTPDSDFNGVDTFRVVAIDAGLHINLLDLFRPIGTRANSLINQRAINFDFTFTDDGTGWTPERQLALQEVADQMTQYFLVTAPVTLTYTVGLDDRDNVLASAASGLVSTAAGYWRTVVQNKLLTGVDSNGAKADGEIDWNWASTAWGLGEDVGSDEYDFVSTAIHELLHSFGFLSYTDAPGENTERRWAYFDRFLVTEKGTRPIGAFYRWRSSDDPKLIGDDGGLFFGGANAIAAYGGLIPLFTPDPWSGGSSMSHLDDFTFTDDDQKLMNSATDTGLGVRVLSAIELGILKDLGYNVVMPQSPPYAAAFVGLLFIGLRPRKTPSARR